jgi:hypothetical protein
MEKLPKDLSILREKINQQRNTIEALKRGGHECADAERQLKQMMFELQISENAQRSA